MLVYLHLMLDASNAASNTCHVEARYVRCVECCVICKTQNSLRLTPRVVSREFWQCHAAAYIHSPAFFSEKFFLFSSSYARFLRNPSLGERVHLGIMMKMKLAWVCMLKEKLVFFMHVEVGIEVDLWRPLAAPCIELSWRNC